MLTTVAFHCMSIASMRLVGHGPILGGESLAAIDATILATFASVPDSMFLLFRLVIGAQSDDAEPALVHLMGRTPAIMCGFVSSCLQLGPCPPS